MFTCCIIGVATSTALKGYAAWTSQTNHQSCGLPGLPRREGPSCLGQGMDEIPFIYFPNEGLCKLPIAGGFRVILSNSWLASPFGQATVLVSRLLDMRDPYSFWCFCVLSLVPPIALFHMFFRTLHPSKGAARSKRQFETDKATANARVGGCPQIQQQSA
jgi:hypothetical protein